MSKKQKSRSLKNGVKLFFSQKRTSLLIEVCFVLVVAFFLVSFINPQISSEEVRKDCHSSDIQYDSTNIYCIIFIQKKKVLSTAYYFKVTTEDGEKTDFENKFNIFSSSDSIKKIIDETVITWDSDGVVLEYKDQKTNIGKDQFVK